MSRNRRRALLALTVPLVALSALTACGDDTDTAEAGSASTTVNPTASDPAPDGFPVTVNGATGAVTLDARPERIVVLSPTHTEMIFAIGAGGQVVAIDDQSTYPPEALDTPHDLSGFQPNLEAITAYEPDLVVIGDDFTGLTDQLTPLGIPVWSGATAVTFGDVYEQIEQLGALTGNLAAATALVADMQVDIEQLVSGITPFDPPLTYYHELDDTYYSVSGNTFIGEVYGLFGLRNIVDRAEVASDFPQLSAEFIVEQEPDLIFLACTVYCGTSASSVGGRPGWGAIPAVVNGNVVELDDSIVSRWGPRVVEFVRTVADALSGVEATAG